DALRGAHRLAAIRLRPPRGAPQQAPRAGAAAVEHRLRRGAWAGPTLRRLARSGSEEATHRGRDPVRAPAGAPRSPSGLVMAPAWWRARTRSPASAWRERQTASRLVRRAQPPLDITSRRAS